MEDYQTAKKPNLLLSEANAVMNMTKAGLLTCLLLLHLHLQGLVLMYVPSHRLRCSVSLVIVLSLDVMDISGTPRFRI